MGFFTNEELASLLIRKMNFQVVGESQFERRPDMESVEQDEFFLERIRDVDLGSAFEFTPDSACRTIVQEIATDVRTFASGAVTLAREFHGRHVGQSKPGAFFFFELGCDEPIKKIFAVLKYDYSEVLTLRRANNREQLRKIVQAFVKDKKALQKSALIRVVDGMVENEMACRDRGAKSPDITDFFSSFLGARRNRDDVELNRSALDSINEAIKATPPGYWRDGPQNAMRAAREALRQSLSISEELAFEALYVAAGRPIDPKVISDLQAATSRAWRKRKLSGLSFPPDPTVFRVAPRRRIHTVERIRLSYPDELSNVLVTTQVSDNGSAVITINTARIETNEIDNENLGSIRGFIE